MTDAFLRKDCMIEWRGDQLLATIRLDRTCFFIRTWLCNMAISIEGYSIVGLKSRIEENYDGGIAGLSKLVLNATELADDDLWRCAFMVAAEAEKFLERKHGAACVVVNVAIAKQNCRPWLNFRFVI